MTLRHIIVRVALCWHLTSCAFWILTARFCDAIGVRVFAEWAADNAYEAGERARDITRGAA